MKTKEFWENIHINKRILGEQFTQTKEFRENFYRNQKILGRIFMKIKEFLGNVMRKQKIFGRILMLTKEFWENICEKERILGEFYANKRILGLFLKKQKKFMLTKEFQGCRARSLHRETINSKPCSCGILAAHLMYTRVPCLYINPVLEKYSHSSSIFIQVSQFTTLVTSDVLLKLHLFLSDVLWFLFADMPSKKCKLLAYVPHDPMLQF